MPPRYLVALLTLTIVVTPRPAIASQEGSRSNHPYAQQDQRRSDVPSSPVEARPAAPPPNHDGAPVEPQHNPHAVRIVSVPPITVRQDIAGWLTIVFTGGLVLVGIGGIIAALLTLRSIKRQTRSIHHQAIQVKKQTLIFAESAHAAKESAEAAKGSADALISSERAWLLVEAMPTGPTKVNDKWVWLNGTELTGMEIITHRNIPERIGYTIKNYGRTPGWITSHWSKAVIVQSVSELPVPPNYLTRPASIFMKDLNMVYVPGQERKNEIVIPLGDLAPIAYRKTFLYMYGVISYRDITSKTRETRFCFLWHVPTERDLNPQGFYQEGPEGYNGET